MNRCMAGDLIKGKFPETVIVVEEFRGETTITVDKEQLRKVMAFLKESESLYYDLLLDLAGIDTGIDTRIDNGHAMPRFTVAYLLHSTKFNNRLRIKVRLEEGASLDTVSDIWKAANWLERETYDMLGILFNNHPDLRRILLSDDFVGYPLRKDFPLQGHDFDKPVNVCLEEEL